MSEEESTPAIVVKPAAKKLSIKDKRLANKAAHPTPVKVSQSPKRSVGLAFTAGGSSDG